MGCGQSQPPPKPTISRKVPLKKKFQPRITNNERGIAVHYEVVVIGSGHAGGVAASRAARAGRAVCVLEKGKEWLPGQFPDKIDQVKGEVQVKRNGKRSIGTGNELFDCYVNDDVTVLTGCGVGGTSLISSNVMMEPSEEVLKSTSWPRGFREDIDNFREDLATAKDMFQPAPYPYTPAKVHRMEELANEMSNLDNQQITDIEDIGIVLQTLNGKPKNSLFHKVDLGISYEQRTNRFGMPLESCTGCGNCTSGCNVGAKHTVNITYLADAKYHGAEIFSEVTVNILRRSPINGRWQVEYTKRCDGEQEDFTISAENVILCAGTLGSTELLLRSQKKGLDISDQLGKGFSGNGDRISYSYATDRPGNSFGTPYKRLIPLKDLRPGPSTISVIDLRDVPDTDTWSHKLVLHDFTLPLFATELFRLVLLMTPTLNTEDWQAISEKIEDRDLAQCVMIQAISHDDQLDEDGKRSSGEIHLATDSVKIEWGKPEVVIDADQADVKFSSLADKCNYVVTDKIQRLASNLLGGKYVPNPSWSEELKPSFEAVVTSLPLGGCCMGESGMDGVVNHKGQVFKGNTKAVHKGLYVIDGAVIPQSLGAYPALTITAVAERSMRLMAADLHWEIYNKDFIQDPESIKWDERGHPMGMKALEFLEGYIKIRKEWVPCKAKFTLITPDIQRTLFRDPRHRMDIDGLMLCPAIDPDPMIASGTVDLIAPDTTFDETNTKNMWYKIMLEGADNKSYYLLGHKALRKDEESQAGWIDPTTLFIRLYRIENDKKGKKIGEGEISVNPRRVMSCMRTLQVNNTINGAADQLQFKLEFAKFLLRETWDIFSPFSRSNSFYPRALPRWKRPLDIPDAAQPIVYNYVTPDGLVLQLIRYNGGPKGPIVLSHGIGMSSAVFTLDTVKTNLVEYLVSKKYDVWCMDWRGSVRLPYAVEAFTLDDVSAYDYPTAIDRVLEVTEHTNVQMVVHCAGAEAFFASMLSGQLEGKVRSIVTMETAFILSLSAMNKLKAGLYSPEVAMALGLTEMNALHETSWFDDMLRKVSEALAETTYPWQKQCKSHVCHRIIFIYGLLWQHANLNDETHFTLHELFGVVNSQVLAHLARNAREGKLTGAQGDDLYLPGLEEGLENNADLKQCLSNLNVPICFMNGSNNECYDPDGLNRACDLLKSANEEQDYRRISVEEYGHLDTLIGKDACRDVFPVMLDFLDSYANSCTKSTTSCYYQMYKTFLSRDEELPKWNETDAPSAPPELLTNRIEHPDFDEEPEDGDIPLKDRNRFTGENPMDLVPDRDEAMNNVSITLARKSEKESDRLYKCPTSEHETIVVEKVTIKNTDKKNCIYALGGFHFSPRLPTEMGGRIIYFLNRLVSAADEMHTLVLNGDIFDMGFEPANEAPRTEQEYIDLWKSGTIPGLDNFIENIKRLSFELDVNVFYIRGDHDHQMTSAALEAIFGSNVKFISGTLIYKVDQGGAVYYARFEHGHDWDPLNTYVLKNTPNGLLGDHTLGALLHRLVPSGHQSNKHLVDTSNIVDGLFRTIEDEYYGSLASEVMSHRTIQKVFTQRLLETITGHTVDEDRTILLNGASGSYISVGQLLKYKLVKRMNEHVGGGHTFDMFSYICGDVTPLLGGCDEDVVVMSHTEKPTCGSYDGRHGDVIYATSGSLFRETEQGLSTTFVKIAFPGKRGENGNGSVKIVTEMAYDVTSGVDVPEVTSISSNNASEYINDL